MTSPDWGLGGGGGGGLVVLFFVPLCWMTVASLVDLKLIKLYLTVQ